MGFYFFIDFNVQLKLVYTETYIIRYIFNVVYEKHFLPINKNLRRVQRSKKKKNKRTVSEKKRFLKKTVFTRQKKKKRHVRGKYIEINVAPVFSF